MPVVRRVDDGGIATKFWNKFKSEGVYTLYTPFFVSLASGNLNSDTFVYCISQDVHFLKAFVQACELAEGFACDDEDIDAIRKLRKLVMERLKTHDALVRGWGFDLPKESLRLDATVKYTDFLLATASGKVEGEKVPGKIVTPFEKTKLSAYVIGAVAPCMRLFAFISKQIQGLLDSKDTTHMYIKWINEYCSQNFEESALQTEALVDKLSASLIGEELEVMEKLYHQAMKHALNFFSGQPVVLGAILPLSRVVSGCLTIFCDFDLACTAFDSSAVLAEIAILTADKNKGHLAQKSSVDLKRSWDVLSIQYTEEYEDCIESIIMEKNKEPNFDYEGLCKALVIVAEFERKANSRVVESGVLKGIKMADIKRAGQSLILNDGCRGFFQKIENIENLKYDAHVVSYSWCGDLARSAFSSGPLHALKVHANDLVFEESVSTGELVKKVESPMDKLQVFNNVLKDGSKDEEKLTVYIGGSVGDMLCLLEANVGIVLGSSSSLRKLGAAFGVMFVPLFSGLVAKQREVGEKGSSCVWKARSGVLYTVSSWDEIHAFILGS